MAFLDDIGLGQLWGKITSRLNNKVDKVSGKGLSTNDYTNDDKAKLDGIEVFQGASGGSNGTEGLVPQPMASKGDTGKFLKGDGTWADPEKYTHPSGSGYKHVPSGGKNDQYLGWGADGTAIWKSFQSDVGSGGNNAPTAAAVMAYGDTVKAYCTSAANQNLDTYKGQVEATYAKKSDLSTVYKYKGSVNSASDLPGASAVEVGWVYNIESDSDYGPAGMNVGWTGEKWDPLGSTISVTALTTEEINEICVQGDVNMGAGSLWSRIKSMSSRSTASMESANAANRRGLLDGYGLETVWNKMKEYVAEHVTVPSDITGNAATATKLKTARTIGGISFDGSKNIYHYGTCYTSATLKSKTSSITGLVLSTGAKVAIRFVNGISVNDATLNVTGTGAKQIKYKGKNLKAGAIQKNTLVELIYNGSSWLIIGELSCAGAAQDFFGSHNLNDCTTPGRYICHVSPNETWENAPSGWNTSWLDVNENQGVISQTLREYDGRYVYTRGFYKRWSAWRKIVSEFV